jgi:hypothetical protein
MKERLNPKVTIFYDGNEPQQVGIMEELKKQRDCVCWDINGIKVFPSTPSAKLPEIYAPEGIFRGANQIDLFLKIPPESRLDALRDLREKSSSQPHLGLEKK